MLAWSINKQTQVEMSFVWDLLEASPIRNNKEGSRRSLGETPEHSAGLNEGLKEEN